MKETVIYVAMIMMEFNDEAVCNAFYKGYNSTPGHTPQCSMIIRYDDKRELSVGTFDHVTPPPLPRPAAIANMRAL